MARGWESKSVEEQQDLARNDKPDRRKQVSPEQAEAQRRKDVLLMSRAQVKSQIAAATNPVHRQMLERALADLERDLASL